MLFNKIWLYESDENGTTKNKQMKSKQQKDNPIWENEN